MENMATALRMAAGVMLALLLITLIVYIFQIADSFEEEKSQKILVEQVNEFNKKFTAFEKSSMYGTDVMSVISLAINNNRDLNAARSLHPDGNYVPNLDGSVNIKIKLRSASTIQKKKWEITIDNSKSPDDPEHYIRKPVGTPTNYFPSKDIDLSSQDVTRLFQDMITENKTITTKQKSSNHGMVTTIIQEDTIGIEDFKSSIFTCTETKHSQTGKIYEMTFTDITK